jgi:hypothetical protein
MADANALRLRVCEDSTQRIHLCLRVGSRTYRAAEIQISQAQQLSLRSIILNQS